MPLMHSKRPAAFKRNIETEMRAGKPQKQAVAIAYSEKHEAEERDRKKMAEGGAVKDGKSRSDNERGVHASIADKNDRAQAGTSQAGYMTRMGEGKSKHNFFNKEAKGHHEGVLEEAKDMPGPTSGRSGFAEGGDVETHEEPDGDEMDMDTELSHGLGKELMHALDSKDHKAVMDCMEACIMHCMNKGENDV